MITHLRAPWSRLAYLTILVSLTALPACQAGGEGPPGASTTSRPIINGTPDTSAAHMAVVSLGPTQSSGYVGGFCTGTLITPTWVLTAAHCVENESVGSFDVKFTNNYWQSGTYRSVSEIHIHPTYTGQQNLVGDIALVRLASAAPTNITPIPALPASQGLTSADEGSPVTFVGFGLDENNNSGVKLTVTGSIGKVCPGPSGCSYAGAWVVQKAIGYPQTPGGPCSGDSGGPAFVTRSGQEYTAGVTSYGDEYCSQYGVSTMVNSYESWILGYTGGVASENCSNGVDDDGDGAVDCADPDCANAANCQTATACEVAQTLTCGGQVSGSTVGGATGYTTNSCLSNPENGPERAYELSAPAGTSVTATLTPGAGGDLDLFLFPASGAGCNPAGCLASSLNEGTAVESIQFTMPAGGAFLVVETWDTATSYTLQLSCQGTQLENCVNGVDDDGDGLVDCADPDCAAAPGCQPGAEQCANGLDDDGDGLVDCDDPDCAGAPGCTSTPEVCNNGLDDDGDGAIDCADPDCVGSPACAGAELCGNNLDDDGDGAIDCADPDCATAPSCQPKTVDPGVTKGGCHCAQDGSDAGLPLALPFALLLLGWIRRRG